MDFVNLSILLLFSLVLGTVCHNVEQDFSPTLNPFADYWRPQARAITESTDKRNTECRIKTKKLTEAFLSTIGKFPKPAGKKDLATRNAKVKIENKAREETMNYIGENCAKGFTTKDMEFVTTEIEETDGGLIFYQIGIQKLEFDGN